MILLALLALPFLGSLLCLCLPKERFGASTAKGLTLIVTGSAVALLTFVSAGWQAAEPPRFFVPWIPEVGLNFSLWLDGPALFFAWIVLGLGFLIFAYAASYMDPKDSPWRFFGTMMFFCGSMLGVVMAKNAMLMFVFWELTSVSSFILIGHWHQRESARSGAVRALVVTGLGGLALLAGLAGFFWMLGGKDPLALEWDRLWLRAPELLAHPTMPVFLVLVLVGAFTKSAQFPFHFWLPGAMEAPTPVSAYLHAATMVKAGIYLLGRLYPIFHNEQLWLLLVGLTGVITMLIGGFMAILSHDLKQLLAHSTVSQLGLLTAYYGFGAAMPKGEALPLDLLMIASHAFFKGALFMLCGSIDHGCHTRDWTKLGGLRKTMPVTAVLTIIGSASMAGVPLTLGFVAKELFLHRAIHLETTDWLLAWLLPVLAITASIFTVAYSYRLVSSPFFGEPRDPHIHPHESGPGLLVPPAILVALCLMGGLYVPLIERPIAALVSMPYFGGQSGFTVGFFHHADLLLLIAAALFSIGALVFAFTERVRAIRRKLADPSPFLHAYGRIFDERIPAFASWLAHTIQVPSLRRNIFLTLTFIFGVIALSMWRSQIAIPLGNLPGWRDGAAFVALVVSAICMMIAIRSRTQFVRLLALSPVGLLVALYFVLFNAPDLALTQVLVEIAMLAIFLFLLFAFPQRMKAVPADGIQKGAPTLVAVGGGLVFGILTLVGGNSLMREQPVFAENPTLKDYYLENTKYPAYRNDPVAAAAANYPGHEALRSGGGDNAVNVIIVDFRGFDTMGEIAVLGIAALGVMTLLTFGRKKDEDFGWRATSEREIERISLEDSAVKPSAPIFKRPTWPVPSMLMREMVRILAPALVTLGTILFFAGHNAPGGGFIAGLVVASAFLALMAGFRREEIGSLHNRDFSKLIPWGLAAAMITGLVAILFNTSFLTSGFTYIHFPILGEFEFASASAFDLGVFLVVIGAVMTIFQRFAKG